MTASSPLGPWKRQGVALAGFAHNPQALLTPNGSVLLFHIGAELPPGCLLDCRGTKPAGSNPHPAKPRPPDCPSRPSHGASVAVAASPDGPFTRHNYIFGSDTQTNPAPWLESDGTLLVALRRGTVPQQTIYRGRVEPPAGPWERLNATVYATGAGSTQTYEEDPFLYGTARGWHMITRRSVANQSPRGDATCPRQCVMPSGACFEPCVMGDGYCGGGPPACSPDQPKPHPRSHPFPFTVHRASIFYRSPHVGTIV